MGAKTPEQISKVRPAVKCDECGRKFLNASALKSHYKFLHILKSDRGKRVAQKKQVTKKVVPVHLLKRVNPSPETNQEKKTEVTEKSPDLAGKQTTVFKKPEFECPVCEDKFPVYFTAFRHIQKNHCVDDKGNKVPPNSPQLVKPIRIEMCASCRTEIRSTEPHNCPKQQANRDQFLCLGCEQVFNGLVLFQHHVKGLHADGAQNYFFPTRDEFTSWKTDLQAQAKMELVRLNKQKNKELYHCSHHSASETASTKLCPSTITVREYTKGFHVCYYKEHHGHTVENVQLNKYSKYSISHHTRDVDELQQEDMDDNDLYLQFKKMVTCIVYDAAKVDVTTLKELLGKALEMTTVLKHYQSEELNTPLISKCLTDAQISRTLDSLKPSHGKRKLSLDLETKTVEVKKVKKTPSIERMVENGMTSRLRSSPAVNRNSPLLNKSVSFSKSVPKKIEETPLKITPKKKVEEVPQKSIETKKVEDTPQKSVEKKKVEVPPQKSMEKKKIEETPQKSMDKKKIDEPPQKTTEKKKIEEPPLKSLPKKVVEMEIKKQEEFSPPTPVPRSLLQSPSSFNDSYKNFVDQNFKCLSDTNTSTSTPISTPKPVSTPRAVSTPKPVSTPKSISTPKPVSTPKPISTPRPKTNVKKKEVVKTKMGQFKVKSNVTSPKDNSPTSPKVSKDLKEVPAKVIPKNWKAKEIQYEVKEQENDCNILILKI